MTRTPSSTDDPQPGHGRSRDKADPQHCDQEVTCMDYPSYCEENETPCPLVNCKRRGTASDTPQPEDIGKQPERHCEHEKMCHIIWHEMMRGWTHCERTCEDDTRFRPHTSTPEPVPLNLSEQIRGLANTLSSLDLVDELERSLNDLKKVEEELWDLALKVDGYDTALIQRTREEVLAHLIAKLSEVKSQIESSAMGGPITERNRGRFIGILDALIVIGSLRIQPPTTGSTTGPAKGKEE